MPQLIAQGGSVPLDAYYKDANGLAATPTDPLVEITNPDGDLVLSDTPTQLSVGHFQLLYDVAADAMLGGWGVHWSGLVNGSPVDGFDVFTVIEPGAITTPAVGVRYGPCDDWVTWDDVVAQCPEAESADEATQLIVLAYVSEVMWALSCRQFGICTEVARPCTPRCRHQRSLCSCGRYEFIELGSAPIASVVEIKIDGDVLASENYRVDEWHRVVRLDGEPWPACQQLELADTEVGTWSIQWQYGISPTSAGALAAALFACDVVGKLDPSCSATPPGTTSATQEGVTINILDPTRVISEGLTGVPLVDLWLGTVCPGGPSKRSGGIDFGVPRGYVRTNT